MYSRTQNAPDSRQLARLSLVKFSHATLLNSHTGHISWVHIRGNLEARIENTQDVGSAVRIVRLRILQNHEILEELDLSQFAREARNYGQLNQNAQQKSPFAVLVKAPCLAMKYPKHSTYTRRIQLQFPSDRDYYAVLAILSDIDCPFTESIGPASQTPIRPASWVSGISPSASNMCEGFLDNGSAAPSNHHAIVPFPSSTDVISQDYSNAPVVYSANDSPNNITSLNGPASHLSNDNTARDAAAHAGRSQSTLDGSLKLSGFANAITHHDIQTLNELLPPRRELPFRNQTPAANTPCRGRSQQTGQGRGRIEKQAETERSLLTPPATASTVNKPSALREQAGLNTDQSYGQLESRSAASNFEETFEAYSSRTANTSTEVTQTRRIVAENLDPEASASSSVKTQHSASTKLQPSESSASQPGLKIRPVLPSPVLQNEEAGGTILPTPSVGLGKSAAATSHQPNFITTADLSSYSSAPVSERAVLVETWVCQQLEDEGFLQLCRDIEAVWQRIALGV